MARGRQDAAKPQESVDVPVPGTNVIARVKGYPAWPAVVVDEKDVPDPVRKVKPPKKVVVPVLFYNDNSFLWISPQEADSLTQEQATKNSKAKIKRALKDAYAIAANPPEYEKLVAIATGKAEPSDSENGDQMDADQGSVEAEEENVKEPEEPERPAPRSRRARTAFERAQEQLPARPRATNTASRKRGRAEPTSAASHATATKKGKHAEVSDGEDDSEYVDNGSEETDEASTGVESEGVSEDLVHSQAARFELCSSIRQVIQENLLTSEAKISGAQTSKTEDALRQLDDAPEIELCVVRRSKLVRVVFNSLQLPQLPNNLRAKLESWAEQWNTKAEPVIRGIPEDLAPKEETEEPEDYDVSIDPSREPTEGPESKPEAEGSADQADVKEESAELKNGAEAVNEDNASTSVITEKPHNENGEPAANEGTPSHDDHVEPKADGNGDNAPKENGASADVTEGSNEPSQNQ